MAATKKPKENDVSKEVKSFNKWKSRRWLITVWSMLLITSICVLGIIFENDSYVSIAVTLVTIPVGFVSLESVNKWKVKKEDEK